MIQQVPVKTTCNACHGQGYFPTGQTYPYQGREHIQLACCSACDGKGTLLEWVDLYDLTRLLKAIQAEQPQAA